MSKPMTFQKLATKVLDMKITIAKRCGKSSSSYKFKKDKGEAKKSSKPSKVSTKKAMVASTKEPTQIEGKARLDEKKGSS